MNKIVKSLLVAAVAISAQNVSAHTNKTYMATRNQALRNLPLEMTTTKERTVAKLEDRFGGTISATGFYGQNTKKDETGKYFGVNSKNEIKLGDAAAVAAKTADLVSTTIINAPASTETIKIAPEVIDYGVNLGWYQDLSKICSGLNLKVAVPVEHKEQDMKLSSKDANVVNYFKGNAIAGQEALKYGKIAGKQSATGVADIDVQLGYRFLDKESYNAGLNLAVVIPTGKDVKSEYAFAPQVGGKHWGLGAGLDAQARVWGSEEHNVKINFAANYRYMFEATEKRTLGLKDMAWGQYRLVNATNAPVANGLTHDVNVTPGSQLDAILGLAYNNGGFTADLGYNLYFAEQESVKVKGTLANPTLAGAAVATAIDATAAETPAQFTNSIYGGVGYSFKEWEYPVTLGLGGKYEFAAKNSALEGWQAWAKAGLSF